MKKYFLLLSLIIIGLSACKKKETFDTAAQAAADEAIIKAYIQERGITNAVKDASGLYYQIINAGTGAHATASSGISVSYTLTYPNGTVLDSRPSSYFSPLSDLITGWQIGVPKIGVGGNILLMVPSALGYGNEVHGSIAASSVLIFNLSLQGIN